MNRNSPSRQPNSIDKPTKLLDNNGSPPPNDCVPVCRWKENNLLSGHKVITTHLLQQIEFNLIRFSQHPTDQSKT